MANDVRFLLDNDTFNHFLSGNVAVREKLETHSDVTWLSMVAVVETLRGTLKSISDTEAHNFKPSDKLSSGLAYDYLLRKLYAISQFQLLPFDDAAAALFKALNQSIKTIGVSDCRIAASAITYGYTVVTRNVSDFENIAKKAGWIDLKIVNWVE